MPTFIDESGDTGHEPNSSPYFRLAAVWIPTQQAADGLRQSIQQVRANLALPATYEFKFSKSGSHPQRRTAFFSATLEWPFRFAVVSVDKRQGDWRTAGGGVIHWACAVMLAASLRSVYLAEEQIRAATGRTRPLNELVVVDDNQDQEFLAVVKEKFRELRSGVRPGASLVGKVKFRGSGPDELLQLADMVCGAAGALVDGDPACYDMIAGRSLGIDRVP